MQHSEALEFVAALRGMIRQLINEARPGNDKRAHDGEDYEQTIVDALTGKERIDED